MARLAASLAAVLRLPPPLLLVTLSLFLLSTAPSSLALNLTVSSTTSVSTNLTTPVGSVAADVGLNVTLAINVRLCHKDNGRNCRGACTREGCNRVGGFNECYNATSGRFYRCNNDFGTSDGWPGGVNFQSHKTLFPANGLYALIEARKYDSYSQCCRRCAELGGCTVWHYFPTGVPILPCPSGIAPDLCSLSVWRLDGLVNCALIKFTGISLGLLDGPECGGTHRTYWGGACNPLAGVQDDPHFVGGHGTRYDFNGEVGKTFCLITDRSLHVNMVLGGYLHSNSSLGTSSTAAAAGTADDGKAIRSWITKSPLGASSTAAAAGVADDGKAIRSWITALTFMWRDANGTPHKLEMVARTGTQQKRHNGFIAVLRVDGTTVETPTKVGTAVAAAGMVLNMTRQTMVGPFDYDEMELTIGRHSMSIGARIAHPLLQTQTEAYAHFNVRVRNIDVSTDVHGVLGQTFRQDAGRVARSIEYKMLSALLRQPIKADSDSGRGFLDGSVGDYVSSSPDAADCKFATAWNAATTPAAALPQPS